jgi:hypothetical protein
LSGGSTASRTTPASRTPAASKLDWFDDQYINDHGVLRRAEPEELVERFS